MASRAMNRAKKLLEGAGAQVEEAWSLALNGERKLILQTHIPVAGSQETWRIGVDDEFAKRLTEGGELNREVLQELHQLVGFKSSLAI